MTKVPDMSTVVRRYLASNSQMFERIDAMGGQAARVPEDERFERVFDDMEAHEAPRQKVFFEGQVFDAFELLVSLVQHAKESIVLIDGHADADTLNTLAKKNGGVAFTL